MSIRRKTVGALVDLTIQAVKCNDLELAYGVWELAGGITKMQGYSDYAATLYDIGKDIFGDAIRQNPFVRAISTSLQSDLSHTAAALSAVIEDRRSGKDRRSTDSGGIAERTGFDKYESNGG